MRMYISRTGKIIGAILHVIQMAQAFKPGRVVAARVTGARPMDGLVACTLKASAVEGGALTFDDITPGQLISGTVDGVEDFGVFVKLAAGLKCAPYKCSRVISSIFEVLSGSFEIYSLEFEWQVSIKRFALAAGPKCAFTAWCC